MDETQRLANRRWFLARAGLTAAAAMGVGMFAPGAFAEALEQTPGVEEGPFYPPKLPLDTDNDLLIVNDAINPAVGEIAHLSGRLLDASGAPVRNATIEIWQVDNTGVYLAERGRQQKFDANFQGFGRFCTGSTGEYYFRTIKPARYPGRSAPHIHFAVKLPGKPRWTTQLFIKGDAGNDRDGIYRGIPARSRESVTRDFAPMKDEKIAQSAVKFDIVIGVTPRERDKN